MAISPGGLLGAAAQVVRLARAAGRATFGRLSRWKVVYRMQLAYMVIAVVLVMLTIAFWGWRQGQQAQILERYYQEAGRVE